MIRKLIVLGIWLLPALALAQQPVYTLTPKASNLNLSGTIASTNTFQSIQTQNDAAKNGRLGCTIQNLAVSNKMWVYFGPVANALTQTSIQLAAGDKVNCAQVPGALITDQVSITGTAGDSFYAGFQ